MSQAITFNSVGYTIPEVNDVDWGEQVTNYLVAISTGSLQKSGGGFTLTSEVDFGGTYGLKSLYFLSRAADAADSGVLRLGNADSIAFRDSGDTANQLLTTGSADGLLEYDGVDLVTISATQTLTNKTLTSPTIGGYTINRALETDGSGNLVVSTVTSTELGYLSGVTSAIQTQLDAKASTGGYTASRALETDGSGNLQVSTVTSTELGYLSGVTSAIQTQIDGKAPTTRTLTAGLGLSGLGDLSADRQIDLDIASLSIIAPDPVADFIPFYDADGATIGRAIVNTIAGIYNLVEDTTPQLGGTLEANGNAINMADNTISRPEFTDYSITHTTPTITAGSVTFDCVNGNSFDTELDQNITSITLSNPPGSGNYGEIRIRLHQNGTGGYTVSGWPASVKWPLGTAPVISTGPNISDVIILHTENGGTTWFGNYSQGYS